MTPRRHELSDEQWEQIQDLFPSYRTGRPPQLSSRTALHMILWIARSGEAWARFTFGEVWLLENSVQPIFQLARY
ncbi:transposase [Paenibacillus sp. WLX2291]|uniref:transposase n=1 Tax=Paenibacillus sp. WLX2291 TaxID=3296934 RepID=UPI0039840265